MVSEMPGTTRDTVDVLLRWRKRLLRLVDTAGQRRPGRVAQAGAVEAISVDPREARDGAGGRGRAGRRCDRRRGRSRGRDCRRGRAARLRRHHRGQQVGPGARGRGRTFVEAFDDKLRFQLKFLEYAPILHLSALTGDRTAKLLEAVDRVAAARLKRVSTSELNKFLERVTTAHPPTSKGRREVRILYGAQTAVDAARVRALHQRRDGAALFLRAIPRQPAAGDVRVRRHADSAEDQETKPVALVSRPCTSAADRMSVRPPTRTTLRSALRSRGRPTSANDDRGAGGPEVGDDVLNVRRARHEIPERGHVLQSEDLQACAFVGPERPARRRT